MQKQKAPPKQIRNPAEADDFPELDRVQKRIYRQAALAGLTVVLTIVILFAVTSAWYTNIVQTSGLVFQAESWGFDGEIVVDDSPIVAAPGDDGIVHLEVQNKADSISAISLNVSKANMSPVMKKRLFFYVDTRMERSGEVMDRVYLNNFEGYTYTLFSQGSLVLTEQRNNAPQLKWEWVYDVLGYYVMAQPVTHESVLPEEGGEAAATDATEPLTRMEIRDYLRPIEYDYGSATFDTVTAANGGTTQVLATVDGTTTVDRFLTELSANDGYQGQIQLTPTAEGFYPVEVDEDGYGVYAYLCTPSQVAMEIQEDTYLGELAYRQQAKKETLTDEQQARIRQEVVLTISAQKNESTAVNVNTPNALQNAIDMGAADVIQLGSNIHLPDGKSLSIPANSRIMLDLNGNTISSDSNIAIKAEPGSTLTMLGGAMECESNGDKTSERAIQATGAEVVMSGMTITGYDYGVYVADNDGGNQLDSRVYMVECTVDSLTCAAYVAGNGQLSQQRSQLVVERCDLKSDLLVVCGNGNADRYGTDIQIIDSTIEGNVSKLASGIYQPQKDSTLTVYNSTVKGYNGIALKGGSARIIGSIIEGQGAYQAPAASGSGFTDTGDAVYIDAGYGNEILLEISDILEDGVRKKRTELNSSHSMSLRVFEEDAPNVAVKISGGLFKEEQPEHYIAEGAAQIQESGRYAVTLVRQDQQETQQETQ